MILTKWRLQEHLIATFIVCTSQKLGKFYTYTLQKNQASVDQKKLPKKSVKEMQSEVYLNLFEKIKAKNWFGK